MPRPKSDPVVLSIETASRWVGQPWAVVTVPAAREDSQIISWRPTRQDAIDLIGMMCKSSRYASASGLWEDVQ